MNRTWFLILTIVGIIGFYILHALEIRYAVVYALWYFIMIAFVRRWYQKKGFWHYWNPLNLLDYFKKP